MIAVGYPCWKAHDQFALELCLTSCPVPQSAALRGPVLQKFVTDHATAASAMQFKWDVEGIEDAEDDFEDLDGGELDAADDAGQAAAPDDGFEDDLAEFENAF